jgi:hypothetical protein
MEIQHLCAECGRQADLKMTRCHGACNEQVPLCASCIEDLEGRYVCELCQEELAQEKQDDTS